MQPWEATAFIRGEDDEGTWQRVIGPSDVERLAAAVDIRSANLVGKDRATVLAAFGSSSERRAPTRPGYIWSGAAMPSSARPRARTRAVSSARRNRLRRRSSVGAFRTGQLS